MSPVESYLADLRTALGDRLPPALKEARLRETRGHLLASAEDVGEVNAVRRYGHPRAVANGLVRAQRGYNARSVWRLIMPVAMIRLAFWSVFGFAPLYLNDGLALLSAPWGTVAVILFYLAFVVRVAQTRRWLVGPMVAFMIMNAALTMVALHVYPVAYVSGKENGRFYRRRMTSAELDRHHARIPDWDTPRVWLHEAAYASPGLAINAGIWLTLNAAALGFSALLDRRRVRLVGRFAR